MTKHPVKIFLLADDDRDDRDLFSEALAALDPEIVCQGVEDGKQALKLLATAPARPAIIFVDINMPVMNGWDFLRKLKSDEQYLNIPVVVYSTSSREKDREIAHELGAVCFVTKPDNFKMVKGMLEVVLEHVKRNSLNQMCEKIHRTLNT